MKLSFLIITASFYCSLTFGQTIKELFQSKNFNELIKYENKSDNLTGEELYMIGFSFFRLENDNKAITFYDKAIAKGFDNGTPHFYKALSLRYLNQFDDALKEVDIAIKDDPTNQEFVNEKGVIYYSQGQLDKALEVFEFAKTLPKTYPEPYFWVARIYHEKEEYDKALTAFYETLDNLRADNSNYLIALASIGQLEYMYKKNYVKSAKAYAAAIALDPKNYILYPKLMKAYNEAEEYSKADSIFGLMKIAYNNNELSEDDMKFKNTDIDDYEWNGQKAAVWKYLVDPTAVLDVFYKVYLFNKEGDKIERTFLVEKTAPNPDDANYILCEQDKKAGIHYTYPYGWKTDTIPLPDLKKAVGLILDGKMKYGAASNSK